MTATAEPLKKIRLLLLAGSGENEFTFTPDPVFLEFIFGLAQTGLSPFEQKILGRRVGDTINIRVDPNDAPTIFGPIWHPILHLAKISIMPRELYLFLEIAEIVDADNREVVKALAGSLGSCGSGGSCGCGC